MSNLLKLVLTILVTSAVFDKSCGYSTTRQDEPEPGEAGVPAETAIIVVDAIEDLLEDVKDGATAEDLNDHVSGITFLVDSILADADVEGDEAAAQEVIETVLAAIYGNDTDDDVETDAAELDRAFALLNGLAEAIFGILETPEREGLYETLFAVNIAAASLIDTVGDIEKSVVYIYDPEDVDDEVDDTDDADDDVDDETEGGDEGDDGGDDGDDDGADDVEDDGDDAAAPTRRRRADSME